MLILHRRVGSAVVVGEGDGQVTVTVKDVNGNSVLLMLDGPRSVKIDRLEKRLADEAKAEGETDDR